MSIKNLNKSLTWTEIDSMVQKDNKAIVVFEGGVYDATEFKATHPGGPKFIEDYIGKDITEQFYEAEHTKIALRLLTQIKIGTVFDHEKKEDGSKSRNKNRMKEIDGEEWRKLVDPSKGTVFQIFQKLNLEDYTKFINDPKHLTNHGEQMRMFDSDF